MAPNVFSLRLWAQNISLFLVLWLQHGVIADFLADKSINKISHFGKEIKANHVPEAIHVLSTFSGITLLQCVRQCMRRERCYFVNYTRRFNMCYLVTNKDSIYDWQEHVITMPGSVLVVRAELDSQLRQSNVICAQRDSTHLTTGCVEDRRESAKTYSASDGVCMSGITFPGIDTIDNDCGPLAGIQNGDTEGNMFGAGSKAMYKFKTWPQDVVTFTCKRAEWKSLPYGHIPVCFQNGNLWLHENSCYVYMWERRNMEEANEICKGFGGYLTHIETLEENNLLETMLRSFNHNGLLDQFTWIGLTDEETEGVFKWLGETTEANFTHFGPVEPSGLRNENCVALYSAIHYFWVDINCHPHLPYICEYEF